MKKFLISAAIVSLMSVPAFADKHGKSDAEIRAKVQEYMKTIDTNSDGFISKAEYDAVSDRKFSEADTNNDGQLSLDELVAKKQSKKAKMDR